MIKSTLSLLVLLITTHAFSQDNLKIKEIDLLVNEIKQSTLPIKRDSVILNQPELGLKMKTYLTMLINDKELKKYENFVDATMTVDGKVKKMTTSTTFYYNNNKLIKVEEYSIEADKKNLIDWYYSDSKPLLNTLESCKAADRAQLLLTMSENILKQLLK